MLSLASTSGFHANIMNHQSSRTCLKTSIEDLKKKRSAEKMDEACAEMVLRVEDGQLSHMHSRDPMEVWQTL